MHPIIKNILAVIAGWLSGSIINMALISTGHKLLPIEGLDPNDMSAFAEVMPTLEFEYFIFPFLAHALGTLVGAAIASVYFIPYTNRNSSMSSEASKICLFSPLIGTRISNKP